MTKGNGALNAPSVIGPAAAAIHRNIVTCLRRLVQGDYASCLDSGFGQGFAAFLDLFGQYQQEMLRFNNQAVSCARGCNTCCCHWVEDTNSFEAEMIADYVRQRLPERVDAIVKRCESDERCLAYLDSIVELKLPESESGAGDGPFDPVDVLLAAFYQFRRQCPFIGENGDCVIYPVRPLTCRIYVSFADPTWCEPDQINGDRLATYLLDMEEEANDLLDTLHFKYNRYGDDTGLRSLVAKYLRNDPASTAEGAAPRVAQSQGAG